MAGIIDEWVTTYKLVTRDSRNVALALAPSVYRAHMVPCYWNVIHLPSTVLFGHGSIDKEGAFAVGRLFF
jgi:hypothetical protein